MNSKGKRAYVTLLVLIVGTVGSGVWWWHYSAYKKGFQEPFVTIRFHDPEDRANVSYTLYLANASKTPVTVERSDSIVEHPDLSKDIERPCTFRIGETEITFDGNVVSVNGMKLPRKPPYSVIRRDGTIAIGAFLRNFD